MIDDGLIEPKHVVEFLILITKYMLCYWLNKLVYYCKHNGMAAIKEKLKR
jgi:hypothetical protein